MTRRFTPKILSREEERDLLSRWLEHGERRARDIIVESHLPLVYALVKRFRRSAIPVEDLRNEGVIGLLVAVDKFDLSVDVRFSTYARWWVHQQISDHVHRHSQVVRAPLHSEGKAAFFKGERFNIISLDVPIYEDGSSTVVDTFASEDASPEVVAFASIDAGRVMAAIERLPLSDRNRDILRTRLTDDEGTLADLGDIYAVSRERIRQIEAQGIDMLRRALNVEVTA